MDNQVKKLGRPIGSKQKRNESKYWLPDGVSLQLGQTEDYNKSTKLVFIDAIHGEFTASFKDIQDANASVHVCAVSARRAKTNISKYGCENPSSNIDIKKKKEETMIKNFGVPYMWKNPELREDASKQFIKKYGVRNPMDLNSNKEKIKITNLERFGVENPMQNADINQKCFESSLKNGNRYRSKGEKELEAYVQSLGLECKSKFVYDGAFKRQIDIYIESLNIGIEFNGDYFHSEANKKIYPKYHLEKTELCEKNGIRLIQIFEHEWYNSQNQVKSFLRSALNKNENIIYARKCEIKEVPKNIANEFLDAYHIQGRVSHKLCYGIYYKNELLCLATFGQHHRNSQEIVLSRFVGKENYNVVGGLSKIVKTALKLYPEISTWVDRRISTGNNWLKAGWSLKSTLKPDYFYFDNKTGNIISKQSRQKKAVNTPEGMTEHEHALSERLYRIYDCGKLKLSIKSDN